MVKPRDRVGAHQDLAGAHYQVGDTMSLEVTVRGIDFTASDSCRRAWGRVRRHEPTRCPGGPQVNYAVFIDDLRMWVLGITYRF